MKITCPTSPDHKQFTTPAVVSETWTVDAHGDFIEIFPNSEEQVIKRPDSQSDYECLSCGQYGKVTN